ncbi:MAG: hypothetical protein HY885_06945 [Deltaproteobacteria bacterium]|nr:hypothetical protein [Deltaproteobacteria bacterium]
MAVSEINTINPIPPAGQRIQSGNGAGASPAGPSGASQARAAVAAPLAQDLILRNELLINEALRNLNFVAPTPAITRLINVTPPPLVDPEAAQELDIVLQKELLINQALQNLTLVSRAQREALLINETPPILEADETLQDLDAIQQNEVLINEALLTLNLPRAQTVTATEAETAARVTVAGQQTVAAVLPGAGQVTAAVPAAEAEEPVVALPEATTVLAPTPIAATFVTQSFTPFRLPFSLLNPDRTPYVVAVYETRNPNPGPGEPAPVAGEIRPPLPAGRARPTGRAALRQAWANRQVRVYEENMVVPIPVTERDIQHVLSQVNEDLVANGLPLHLVFARNEAGYGVDVYDCSDGEVCRLTHDVTLKIEDLTTTLDNLRHETGIIIDTTS